MASGTRQASEAAPWYRRAFESLYPLIYRHRDDAAARREVDALVERVGLTAPARVLDIACGAGRHMAAFRERGFEVFGMDLSMTLLREAVASPAEGGRALGGRVVSADMRAVPFGPSFDLAVNLFTSFGYFEAEGANVAALRSMASTVKPGGRFVMDHMNRSHVERHGVGDDERVIDGLTVRSRRRVEGEHIVKRMTVRDEAGRTTEIIERVRMYTADQMRAMFEGAGLAVVGIVGSFDGAAFDDQAERMITIGAKR